ncbi:hypothetical protein D3C76_878360 [compost metagenome]
MFELGALQGFGKATADPAAVPAELALGHRIQVLQAALAIDDQQPVVNAVEYRLQALLAGQQFIDVGLLMLAQRVGHQPEAAGQLVEFGGLGDRQGDVEVALAELVGSLGQGFDRLAEAPGDVVRCDETQDQHHQPHQAQHATDQQRAVARPCFAVRDVLKGLFVRVDQVCAYLIERRAQGLVDAHAARRRRAIAIGLEERLVVAAGFTEAGAFAALLQPLVEQGLEIVLEALQVFRGSVFVEDQGQLLAQVLPQFQAHFQCMGGVTYLSLLHCRHLQHADQPQHQAQQGDRDQCRDAEEKPRAQLHRPFHRLYCLRLR